MNQRTTVIVRGLIATALLSAIVCVALGIGISRPGAVKVPSYVAQSRPLPFALDANGNKWP